MIPEIWLQATEMHVVAAWHEEQLYSLTLFIHNQNGSVVLISGSSHGVHVFGSLCMLRTENMQMS